MQKRRNFFPIFLVFVFLSLVIFASSRISFLKPIDSFSKAVFSPFQSLTYGVFSKITDFASNPKVKKLSDENKVLTKKVVDQKKLEADNKALRDQFQTLNPRSANLVPAQIVGAPGFIPGISVPEMLILNRGEKDGVRVGNAVVVKDNLVGKVVKTSSYLSSVLLVTNSSSSFTGKTLETNTSGVVKGQGGGELILDNVILSENLKKEDTVLTKGDVTEDGVGFPPNLIVGKITSVSKKASDLFQKAEVTSLVDFVKIQDVFIITSF
jgi:rod shape-determining protein MreC